MAEKIDTNYLRGLNPPSASAAIVAQVLNDLIDEVQSLRQEVEQLKQGQLKTTTTTKDR